MIGRSGERGSGISVLAARHDDDDDDDWSIMSWDSTKSLYPPNTPKTGSTAQKDLKMTL